MTVTTTTTTTSTAIYVYVYICSFLVSVLGLIDVRCHLRGAPICQGRKGRGMQGMLAAAVVAVEEKGVTVVEIGLTPWCLGFVLRRKVCNGCWFCARKQTNELACACLRPSPPASLSLSASLTVSLSTACLFVYWLCPGQNFCNWPQVENALKL